MHSIFGILDELCIGAAFPNGATPRNALDGQAKEFRPEDAMHIQERGVYVNKWMKKQNERLKKIDFIDVKMVKWSAVAFALMIAKLWPPLLALSWYWYMLIGIALMIRPLYKAYIK